MIPKRKTTKSQPATQTKKSSDGNMTSIVELLQNQIEEERKNARNNSQSSSRQQRYNATAPRQVLQKKKINEKVSNPTDLSNLEELQPPPKVPNTKPNSRAFEEHSVKPAATVAKPPQGKAHAEMSSMAVGEDEPAEQPPQPKKKEPTGFTYFDRLNEKDIFLDPCDHF